MAETCRLCFRPPTKRNPLNTHHIKGRRKRVHLPVMRVHSLTCHKFCDWITSHYLLHGWEEDLTEKFLVELYHRMVLLQRDGQFTFRLYS